MKMKLMIAVLSLTSFVHPSWGEEDSSCHAFPENTLRFSRHQKGLHTNRFEFEKQLKVFEEIMAPKIHHYYNKDLKILGVWDDDRVNATASRDSRENPVITVAGGLARHPRMDRDALYLILCHELGHQFGGAPKQLRGNTQLRSWSSAEGQADYYATSKCMPYLLERLKLREDSYQAKVVPNDVLAVCQSDLCRQIAQASHQVAMVFYDVKPLGRAPELKQFDKTVAYETQYKHPNPQCRLDTFLSGSHCEIEEGISFDDRDAAMSACSLQYKARQDGARPSCWFNPQAY